MVTRNTKALVLWLVAGVPVLIGTLQSIGALSVGPLEQRYLQNWTVIGPVVDRANSLEIFEEAGLAFFAADLTIYIIFIAIAVAWLGFGISFVNAAPLSSQQRKHVKIGAIAVSGLFYVLLFYVVYREVFFLDVPIAQRVGFGSIPLFVFGALVFSMRLSSAVSGDWGTELADAMAERRETFEREYDQRIAPAIEAAEAIGVDQSDLNEIRDKRNATLARADEIEERIEAARESVSSGEATVPEAKQIEGEVQSFDPDEELESIAEALRDILRSFFDGRYTAFWEDLESPYERTYGEKIVNLRKYNSVVLPANVDHHLNDTKLHIKNIDQIRTELLQKGVPVMDAVEAIQKLETHVYGEDGLVERIRTAETEFERADDELQSELDRAESEAEQFTGAISTAVKERYFEAGGRDTYTRPEIEDQRRTAVELLHQCELDDALDRIRTQRDFAIELREAMSSIELLVGAAENDRTYVDLPSLSRSGVPSPADLEAIHDAVAAETGNSFGIVERKRRVEFDGDTAEEITTTPDDDSSVGEGGSLDAEGSEISPQEVEINVRHHLEQLRDGSRRGSDHEFVEVNDETIVMQVGPVADMFKEGPVYEHLEDFFEEQETIDQYSIDTNGTHGHIEIQPVPTYTPSQCTRELVDSYKNR